MAHKEKIDYLLLDVQHLETMIAGMRDAELYPASFFDQSFGLARKILKELNALEAAQVELLRKQMEAHAVALQDLPPAPAPAELAAAPVPAEAKAAGSESPEETTAPAPQPEENSRPAEEEKPAEAPAASAASIPPPPPAAAAAPDKRANPNLSVNEILEKRKLADFRKAFSLNDRFYFRRELFGGNESRMNQVIEQLNGLSSYDESIAYLKQELDWNLDDQAVADFVKLIEKRFV